MNLVVELSRHDLLDLLDGQVRRRAGLLVVAEQHRHCYDLAGEGDILTVTENSAAMLEAGGSGILFTSRGDRVRIAGSGE